MKKDVKILNPQSGRFVKPEGKVGSSVLDKVKIGIKKFFQFSETKRIEKEKEKARREKCTIGYILSTKKDACYKLGSSSAKKVRSCRSEVIRKDMVKMSKGSLKSRGQTVLDPKQALAIALSKAKKKC